MSRLTCHVPAHSLQHTLHFQFVSQPQHGGQAALHCLQEELFHLVGLVAEAQEQRSLVHSAASERLFQDKLAILQVQQQSTYISW